MNSTKLALKQDAKIVFAFVIFTTPFFYCISQKQQTFDLHKLVSEKKINIFNRKLTTFKEGDRKGMRLSKAEGEGVAWLNGVEFSSGTIEFDVRGEDVKQHSFVGIAFHGVDNATFDAVYLRPFNFRTQDPVAKSHGVQYISLPEFTWRILRANFPDKYESIVLPEPDPNGWQHVRIVIEGVNVLVFINESKEPNLKVQKVTLTKGGAIGFYVADTSGGDFANLTITKSN
jgi:hypothetical protein